MSFRVHQDSPGDAVEKAYFRIQREQMADVPILNHALSVEAVDFQRWRGHWLGVVVTPWCMSVLRVPGSEADWQSTGDNQRRFVRFPAGDFAFLGSAADELGEYQSCSLISPMGQFANQSEAVMTARASLVALLTDPALAKNAAVPSPPEHPSLSRRRFLAMR